MEALRITIAWGMYVSCLETAPGRIQAKSSSNLEPRKSLESEFCDGDEAGLVQICVMIGGQSGAADSESRSSCVHFGSYF